MIDNDKGDFEEIGWDSYSPVKDERPTSNVQLYNIEHLSASLSVDLSTVALA